MNMETYIPVALLSPFIKTYLIIESEEELQNRVLPDTSLVMAFRYKGQVSYLEDGITKGLPVSVVSGLRKSGRIIEYTKGAGNLLVIFKEGGANAFIREPLNKLFEDTIALDSFTGFQSLASIEERLAGAKDNNQRINLVEDFLLSKLYNRKPDKLILTALERIHLSKGIIRIKDLAAELYISLDAFEKRFRRLVGMSPKQFSYIVKMRTIVNSNKGAAQSLTTLAYDAGYFDQPHFNKDFRSFTGQTPTDFFRSPAFW
jgi:AraC-like DNA-binding protein